jgi:hypothetical protein
VTAGYSGTPLVQKLGIKAGSRVALVAAPKDFQLDLPFGAAKVTGGTADVIVAFFTSRTAFEGKLPSLRSRMQPASGLWIAWPKKASGVATDMNEDLIRSAALRTDLVDNKVCAIDETWSGLRLVIRLSARR